MTSHKKWCNRPLSYLCGLGMLMMLSCTPAQAMLPVFDAASFSKLAAEYEKLSEQYNTMKQHLAVAQQQLGTAKAIEKDAEGHYQMGDLLNNAQSLKQRQWTSDNWQSALSGGHGSSVQDFSALQQRYDQTQQALSPHDYSQSTNKYRNSEYINQVMTNKTVAVNSNYAFNQMNHQLLVVKQLSEQIEKTKNTKAAMDLNARLLTELAYLQIQTLKVKVLQNMQVSQNASDAIKEESMVARLNNK